MAKTEVSEFRVKDIAKWLREHGAVSATVAVIGGGSVIVHMDGTTSVPGTPQDSMERK